LFLRQGPNGQPEAGHHDTGFGIGIAHGFATLGTIGFDARFDYAAIGTVSNVASRLCDEAKPGQTSRYPTYPVGAAQDRLLSFDRRSAPKPFPVGSLSRKPKAVAAAAIAPVANEAL
jgi:hypothetical protein